MNCRPRRKHAQLHRFEPSVAFPWRCECGYHFRTEAQMVSHQKAFQRLSSHDNQTAPTVAEGSI